MEKGKVDVSCKARRGGGGGWVEEPIIEPGLTAK
jgi:hypothetical protein